MMSDSSNILHEEIIFKEEPIAEHNGGSDMDTSERHHDDEVVAESGCFERSDVEIKEELSAPAHIVKSAKNKDLKLAMPFKIVQTIDRGRPVLIAVPHESEANGILEWLKKDDKLRRIEGSKPEANYKKINCILKRSNIHSFQQAEIEIDSMRNFSDTDNEQCSQIGIERRNRTSHKVNIEDINFNQTAEQCSAEFQHQTVRDNSITQGVATQEIVIPKKQDFVVISDSINLTNIEKNTNMDNVIADSQEHVIIENLSVPSPNTETNVMDMNDAMTYVISKIDGIAEDFKTINAEYKIITENQQSLFQNQNKIISKLSEIQTQFEVYIKHSSKSPKQNQTPNVKPVDNLKELKELENSLTDPDFEENLKRKVQIVCTKGKKRGTNNAYALIDVLFTRRFLNECSWAGGSKSNEAKICFKSFSNTLDFFLSVLHESDPDFTKPDMQKFFLTVLKNSRQRLQSKQIRKSTKRNRQKVKKMIENSSSNIEDLQNSDESETGYLL